VRSVLITYLTSLQCDGNLPACMTCQVHKTDCHYDYDADKRRLFNPKYNVYFRNPSRQYIESLEARVASLEGLLNHIREADSNSLPEILGELRSGPEDFEVHKSGSRSPTTRKHSDSEESSGPLNELRKMVGSLHLEEGEVSIPLSLF
jgi:hypothetical protein